MADIRLLERAHCREASELEKICLSTAWSEEQLMEITDNGNYCYVTAWERDTLLGVGGAICSSPDSAEIFTVAVSPESRGRGIGGEILSRLIGFCVSKEAECIFLEVEEGNVSAIALYSKFGFENVGMRKGFYHGKNAVIMRLNLKQL